MTFSNLFILLSLFIVNASSQISWPPSPAPAPSDTTLEPIKDGNNIKTPSPFVVFNVTSFGAVGDSIRDDTSAFKLAWDYACQSTEQSLVLVPYGFSFKIQSTIFTGPCKTSLVFQIDGTITPPDGPSSWPKNYSKRQWLVFYRVKDLLMQGRGTIDGRGNKWWNLPCKPHKGLGGTTTAGPCDSPVAIRFFMSSNVTVRRLKVKNSPQFHFRFDSCHDVYVDSVTIQSPALSPNTDGIHIENTNNVQIYNSIISNGDDCVSIGAGCYNVDIRNVTCGPSHGVSIGSLGMHNSRACVWNVTVRDSILVNSDNGVRIKTWQGGSGSVSGVVFNNIRMEGVRNPIIIDQYYCQSKNCSNQTSAVIIDDITYANIRGTYDVRSPPMHLACSDSIPCTNLKLVDVELLPAKGQVLASPFCWNAYGTTMTLTIPPVYCLLEGFNRLMTRDPNQC